MKNKQELYIQLLIVALGVLFFVPFLGRVHLFDWDEINFAEAAREMLATGNFFQVQINFHPFWEKPPLFFWLQSISMSLFGINEFAARFVNAFAGVCTLVVVYRIARKIFDSRFGLLWTGCLAGSFLPHLFYKSGIIDPVFNLFIFLGVYFLFKSENAESIKRSVLHCGAAGVLVGLATLTKGPVALLVVVLCASAYWLWARFRRILSIRAVVVFFSAALIVSLLWYGIETLLHGPWFVTEFVKYQIRLFSTGDAGHGRPFWFHFAVLLFGVFPASFMAIRSFLPSKSDTKPQKRLTRWMIVLFWVVLVLFSIVKTKTVLYSSLCYFPITFLAAYHMHAVLAGTFAWNRRLTASLAAFGILVALIIALFPVVMMHKDWLVPLIQDQFARESLKNPVHWSYAETLIGIGYGAALVFTVALIGKRRFAAGFAVLLLSTAVVPAGSHARLCAEDGADMRAAGRFVSTRACRTKTATHTRCSPPMRTYFISKRNRVPTRSPTTWSWLLNGPIDKPAYFVCRIDKAPGYRSMPQLRELKEEYGFVYFVREKPAV